MSARNRELLALIPASLLVTAGFAAIFIQRSETLSNVSLTYGAIFLALCVGAHLVIRFTLPHADPYLFPLVAVLACFGLVVIYRLDEDLAREQAQWFVFGLALFAGTIIGLRKDFRVLEHYRYTIAALALLLLVTPRLPGIGQQVNGAYLGVKLGPISFQPAEFAKIGIVIFLAAYLRENRDVLIVGARRFLGLTFPPLKHFGPLIVIWGAAMVTLFLIRDIGSSLMFFGGFLAVLYVATNRFGFVVVGLVLFVIGAYAVVQITPHIQDRVDIWLDPFAKDRVEGTGYQIAQSLFAQADGGLFGTGFGQAIIQIPCDANPKGCSILPAPHTDLIYAVIVDELGLAGACGLILVYLLFAARGFKTAMIARDSFSTLLAAGLTAVLALQVFVIVGGVTRVIPLTGVTLPFVSYGGSSILANFVLLALLLLVSDRARREAVSARVKAPIVRLYAVIILLFAILIGFTSRWSVFEAEALRDNANNRRGLLQEQRIKRGIIRSADGKLVAGSEALPGKRYRRRYPLGEVFGHPIGYAFTSIGRSGLEKEYNDRLVGRRTELVSVFDSLLSKTPGGDDLVTTLDSQAQAVALKALRASPSGKGAVVALDVKTGAVRVMASAAPYDPNDLDNPKVFRRLNSDDENTPLLNRATQGLYPPGSTFKPVTATAALDSGSYEPDSRVSGKNNKPISGVPLQNFGGEDFGEITLTEALTKSVNTVWAEVGEKLGKATVKKYMERYGFMEPPPIDLPSDELKISGPRRNNKPLDPASRFVDVGRMAIGQSILLVTPLQMASVAQTIGNGGVRMRPYLVRKAFDPDGRTTIDTEPHREARVMSPETAAKLTDMMKNVVREGTGTAAALEGVEVAGKTGTAELNNNGLNDLWFIGFAGRTAVAVLVEHVQGGQGGTVAAPIAKQVLEALNG